MLGTMLDLGTKYQCDKPDTEKKADSHDYWQQGFDIERDLRDG